MKAAITIKDYTVVGSQEENWLCKRVKAGVDVGFFRGGRKKKVDGVCKGTGRIFFPTPRSHGWMDFDAVQKINLAIQDGLWILVPYKIHLFGAPVRSCLGKSPGFMG